jgi:hypothetical protein
MIEPGANGQHVLTVMRYGDLNPVRAGIVRSANDYAWSSYWHYAFGEPNALIDDEPEYLALGRTASERQLAYRHPFATMLASALRTRRPDSSCPFLRRPRMGRTTCSEGSRASVAAPELACQRSAARCRDAAVRQIAGLARDRSRI